MPEFDDGFETRTYRLEIDDAPARRTLTDLDRLGTRFASKLSGAFADIAVKGKGLDGVLRQLGLSLSQLVLKAALQPLTSGLGQGLAGLFSGGTAFAKGGVLQQGTPLPFAQGGVIGSPVTFPLSGGRLGIAGERGAEAILPLARGTDGRLGVKAEGGGGMNVTFNVTTPDADSFRRSESQVAAMVARAVALGQRNL
jgi:phage-related minor tail protein